MPNYGIPLANGLQSPEDADAANNNPSKWGNALSDLGGSAVGFLGHMLGNNDNPYQDAMGTYGQYVQKGANALNPFVQGGQQEIPNYEQWLERMQNPSAFENNLMNQYQESPTAKYMQQQAIRSAENAGSAEGLVGSSPYTQQVEQNAENISQQDMNNWLQNALGINTTYGEGVNNLITGGERSGNALANLYSTAGDEMANLDYNTQSHNDVDSDSWLSDIGGLAGGIGGAIFGGPGGAVAGYEAGSKL